MFFVANIKYYTPLFVMNPTTLKFDNEVLGLPLGIESGAWLNIGPMLHTLSHVVITKVYYYVYRSI